MCFECLPDTRDGAAGSCAGHEDIHLSFGVLPYLFTCRQAVYSRVGGIGELA